MNLCCRPKSRRYRIKCFKSLHLCLFYTHIHIYKIYSIDKYQIGKLSMCFEQEMLHNTAARTGVFTLNNIINNYEMN